MDVQQSIERSAPLLELPKSCKTEDQLGLDASTLSKIADGSRERNRRPLATAVADLRWRRRCAVQLVLKSAYFIRPDPVVRWGLTTVSRDRTARAVGYRVAILVA